MEGIPHENQLRINTGDGVFMFVAWDSDGVHSETINIYDTEHSQHEIVQERTKRKPIRAAENAQETVW